MESFFYFNCLEILWQCRDGCYAFVSFPIHDNYFWLPVRKLKHCIDAQLHSLAALCCPWEAWPQTVCSLTCLSSVSNNLLWVACQVVSVGLGEPWPIHNKSPSFLMIPATSMGILRNTWCLWAGTLQLCVNVKMYKMTSLTASSVLKLFSTFFHCPRSKSHIYLCFLFSSLSLWALAKSSIMYSAGNTL